MANAKYNSFKVALAQNDVDLVTDTINVMLVTSAYTPNIDTHQYRSDVTNEVVGSGYTSGGQALAGKAVTQDNTNDRAVFDANDVTWTSSTITARGAILYKDTGNSATDQLIAYFDFGSDESSSNGDFVIQWNANGILTLS